MTDDDLIHNDHVNPSMNQDSTKAKWTKAHLQGGEEGQVGVHVSYHHLWTRSGSNSLDGGWGVRCC